MDININVWADMREISTSLSSEHITISSSSSPNNSSSDMLRCTYSKSKGCNEDENEVLSISTTDTERCPVTWDGGVKKANTRLRKDYVQSTPSPNTKVLSWITNSFKFEKNVNKNSCLEVQSSVPSPESKVACWINSNWKLEEKCKKPQSNKPLNISLNSRAHNSEEVSNRNNDKLPFTSAHLNSLTSIESLSNVDDQTKSSILVRQDYKKTDTAVLKCSEDSRTVGLSRSKSTDRKLLEKVNNIKDLFRAKSIERETNIKTKNSDWNSFENCKGFTNCDLKNNKKNNPNKSEAKLHVQKFGSEEIPLSPESQKKRELCAYLQLMNMNPSSTKETILMQNRRSTRVKNYVLLSQKRKLEDELKNKNNSSDNSDIESISHKSFLQLDTKFKENEDTESKTNIFPALPQHVPDSCEDFEKDLLTFISKEKIDVKKSPINTNNGHRSIDKTRKVKKTKLMKLRREQTRKKPNIPKKKEKLKLPNNKQTISCYLNKKSRKLRSTGKLKNVDLKRLLWNNCNNKKITWKKLVDRRKVLRNKTKLPSSDESNNPNGAKKDSPKSTKLNSQKIGVPKVLLTRFNESSLTLTPPKPPAVQNAIVVCNGFESDYKIESKVKTLNDICQSLFNRIVIGPNLSNKSATDHSSSEDIEKGSAEVIVNPDSNTPDVDHNYSKSVVVEVDSSTDIDADEGVVESLVIEDDDDDEMSEERKPEVFNTDEITSTNCEIVPLNDNVEMKSLHRNLTQMKRKNFMNNLDLSGDYNNHTWDSEVAMQSSQKVQKSDRRNKDNSIFISDNKGAIINAFYVDFNLIIVQELMISFWSQSALGNVLGAQNLWIPKGNVQRLVLDSGCVHRKSKETVISLENSVAYVELWTKEHKSDKRERPVSDVFATIYFCRHCKLPDKKVLQLENIKGFAEDVHYIILTNSRNIVVSWRGFCDETKVTIVHCYNLAVDYQTVASIKEMKSIKHYVSSLHNIEDCDNLVLGYGENKVTLWNVDYGYVVATIDLLQTSPSPTLLWARCDRGFLFALQRFSDGKIRLIAINGINHSWKCLQVYKPAEHFVRLRGVCVDNEVLVAFYSNGILSWNIQSGELIYEESFNEPAFTPSGKYVIINIKDQILVKHVLSYLVTCDV